MRRIHGKEKYNTNKILKRQKFKYKKNAKDSAEVGMREGCMKTAMFELRFERRTEAGKMENETEFSKRRK